MEGTGYFLQPTIIKNMNRDMLSTREETFAPVVGLYKSESEEEAIKMANDCEVGLGAFIITESISRSWRATEALEVGMVGVNLGLLSACESPQRFKSTLLPLRSRTRRSLHFYESRSSRLCLLRRFLSPHDAILSLIVIRSLSTANATPCFLLDNQHETCSYVTAPLNSSYHT
jgi:hypothetical protein